MNLRTADLNLLVVVAALLKTRHLTRAAESLHMSQPAMSHALARARLLFHDRLLVRSGNDMLLTPRAQELMPQIEQVLSSVRGMLDQRIFDPGKASGSVRIRATEGAVLAVLPPVLTDIMKLAPHVKVEISSHMSNAYASLGSGDADALLDVIDNPLGREFETQNLFSNTLVCVTSAKRPLSSLNSEKYRAALHAAIEGGTNTFIEHALAAQGIKRQVVLTLPGFLSAAYSIVRSDLILTMPRTLGAKACELFPLRMQELPVKVKPVSLSLVWHARNMDDPLQCWVRSQIIQAGLAISSV